MTYTGFRLENFKGIKDVSINLIKNDLILLLGLNESGKTTILKGIEAFDYLNDPVDNHKGDFFKNIRVKSNVSSNDTTIITASIFLDEKLEEVGWKMFFKKNKFSEDQISLCKNLISDLNRDKEISISRHIPFKNGNPQENFYRVNHDNEFCKKKICRVFAKELVRRLPFIIYFEDFKDRIPEKIFTSPKNDAYNSDWYDIIDGLFYNTGSDLSIESFKSLHSRSNPRPTDAKTILKRVNKTLNMSFSEKWKSLSGVKDIDETELSYNSAGAYFEISITDTDGTTYQVDERSKGALWYLSFLMKTEFRRKKMRLDYGKPVLLIDEPASNLHSSAQQNMIKDFKTLVEDTSVIYSTHSQYLISIDNIKNTYIIKRNNGLVSSTLWSDYIKEDASDSTYYQPLSNVLKLVPTSFDIPWNRAIITEGPSDMKILKVMYQILFPKLEIDFVVYPGASAQKLHSIISLNLGWGSDFKVLLDSDEAGRKAQQDYISKFELDASQIQILPLKNKNIEKLFSKKEQIDIYCMAFKKPSKNKVNKKEFSAAFSLLKKSEFTKLNEILSKDTKEIFNKIFENLELI